MENIHNHKRTFKDTSNEEKKQKYVLYFRVSTQKQGISGLGLDAQRKAVKNYVRKNEVLGEFIEIETGTKKRNRVEVQKAITLCKNENAILLIAKLDRLSRNVLFIANLLDSGVDFIAVDMPQANRLTVHLLSAIAEHEARIISERTVSSLVIARERGTILGSPQNLTYEARLKGANKKRQIAIENENNVRATSVICLLRNQSKMSYANISEKLNIEGFLTSRNKKHTPRSVQMLWNRAKAMNLCNNTKDKSPNENQLK